MKKSIILLWCAGIVQPSSICVCVTILDNSFSQILCIHNLHKNNENIIKDRFVVL